MNIDTIKASFDDCSAVEVVHWAHGLYTGRAIEQGSYFELGATIDQLREDALDRIKKTQHAASNEAGEGGMKAFGKLFRDERTAEVEAVELWEVRWEARYGEYSCSVKPEAEFFTSEEGAMRFARALEDAFKLIRHTAGNKVFVKKKETQEG